MKKMIGTIALASLMLVVGNLRAEDARMTFEQYTQALGVCETCIADNNTEAEALQAEIDAMNAESAQVQGQIDQLWDEIYAACESNEDGANAFAGDIEALRETMMGLNDLTAEQLVEQPASVDAAEARLAELMANPLAKISSNASSLAELERVLEAVKNRMMRAARGWYDVVRGDHLWKIAGKEKVYSDPYQWTRLYSANQDQISNPDLIYPEQRLAVPRMTEAGTYTVLKGDNFVAISEKVYGSPAKWRKIQEANVGLLDKMGGLYPGMILVIP